ncbi:hypothetical protein HanPSC8_Chr13g0592421 [Helianthus annuus]|nr:hypothetical protein HanPSC8_Chr13g0592421 [Helianthus annuus]
MAQMSQCIKKTPFSKKGQTPFFPHKIRSLRPDTPQEELPP